MLGNLEQLHHAIIITGNRAANLDMVKSYANEQGIAWQGNPDVLIFSDDQILMAQANEIIRAVSAKKVSSQRFCVISCDRMAVDVQNTLLKTLEEPQEGNHFFILVPAIDRILPTILSRCEVVSGSESLGETRLEAVQFLAMKESERFALIESFTKSKKDEENLSKSEVLSFIDALEQSLWKNKDGLKDSAEQLFADIRKMREYASIRGASHRVILDFLAIVCPTQKTVL